MNEAEKERERERKRNSERERERKKKEKAIERLNTILGVLLVHLCKCP